MFALDEMKCVPGGVCCILEDLKHIILVGLGNNV